MRGACHRICYNKCPCHTIGLAQGSVELKVNKKFHVQKL